MLAIFLSFLYNQFYQVKNTLKALKMNIQSVLSNITIVASFILFFVLLIAGMFTMSITMIVSAFIVGFIGYAILDHESDVTYDNSNDEAIKHDSQ